MKYLLFAVLISLYFLVYVPLWVIWHFRWHPRNWMLGKWFDLGRYCGVYSWNRYEWDNFEELWYDYPKGMKGVRRYPYKPE